MGENEYMKYNDEMIRKCALWVEENGLIDDGGASLREFCEAMDIVKSTYYEWMENRTFRTTIKKAKETFKENAPKKVVKSLFNNAVGQDISRVVVKEERDEFGELHVKERTTTTTFQKGETAAQIFYLTNMLPEQWKQRQDTSLHSDIIGNMEIGFVDTDSKPVNSESEIEQ